MNNILPSVLVLLCVFVYFASCDEGEMEETPADYLVFGHFYGECIGETCVETFKVENGRVFEADNDIYRPTPDDDLDFVEMAEGAFALIEDLNLEVSVPNELLNTEEVVIGMPDAGDWGGLYIELNNNRSVRYWHIDQMKGNVPQYLHQFVDQINEAINRLNS